MIIVYVTKGEGEGEVQKRILFRTYKKMYVMMIYMPKVPVVKERCRNTFYLDLNIVLQILCLSRNLIKNTTSKVKIQATFLPFLVLYYTNNCFQDLDKSHCHTSPSLSH